MKILYISSACNKNQKVVIDKTAKIKQRDSIINFHNLIITGLAAQKQEEVDVESLIGLPISIKTNKKKFWKSNIVKNNNIIYNQVGFVNIPILKQLTIEKNIKKELKKWIKINKKDRDKAIIVDASYVSILPMIIKIANKNHINVSGIFADIYDYMYNVNENTKKLGMIKRICRNKMKYCYHNMSSYIFLTQNMNTLINKDNKPYLIMEGLISKFESKDKVEKFKTKTIMYAGGIKEEYGIKCIIEAFEKLEGNYEFIICGNGKLEQYVKEKTKKNHRIKYLGTISNEKVKELEKKVTLLVNPRFSNYEYTKYSFPSKIMEYMASGTPVLTTKLQGMPKEYYNYVYLINDETVEGMKNSLQECLSLNNDILEKKGTEAIKFMQDNKNNIKQTQKIIKMIKEKNLYEIK